MSLRVIVVSAATTDIPIEMIGVKGGKYGNF